MNRIIMNIQYYIFQIFIIINQDSFKGTFKQISGFSGTYMEIPRVGIKQMREMFICLWFSI